METAVRTHLFRLFILLTTCLALSPAWAWPDKPVRLVIPYPPGAMGDTVSRMVADDLRARLGQPIVIDNRPGAGGNIGSAFVAQSTDGHTFLVAATNNLVINQFLYRQMPDPLKTFVPVAILVDVPSVIFMNAAVPASSFREFADHAKKNPGKVNYASPGSGTTIHMLSEVLNKRFGLGMAHIAYKGAAPALAALVGNEVQMLAIGAGVGAPHVKSGKLRALAVSAPQRLPMFPNTPTFAEAGLPEEAASNWWGIAAPAATPRDIIVKFQQALREVLTDPKMQARLLELGAIPSTANPEQLPRQLEQEARFWGRTVQELGVQVD